MQVGTISRFARHLIGKFIIRSHQRSLTMGRMLKPQHIKRYKDIGYLLLKYWQIDVLNSTGLVQFISSSAKPVIGEPRIELSSASEKSAPFTVLSQTIEQHCQAEKPSKEEELAQDLVRLGPAFIKLGQFLSRRPDILPLSNGEALSHIDNGLCSLPKLDVGAIIQAQLGQSIERVFRSFNLDPVSISATGQVHRAMLKDGRSVVIKIQRPAVKEAIQDDLECLDELSSFYDDHIKRSGQFDFKGVVDEFSKVVSAELDYRQEAHNLRTLKDNLKALDLIVIPEPIDSYSSDSILTMTYIGGSPVAESSLSGYLRAERSRLIEQVIYAYLQQSLIDGFVDANPDPNEILLTKEGKIALLGMGIVARIAPSMQEQLLRLLLAIYDGNTEQVAETVTKIGKEQENFDQSAFCHEVEQIALVQRDMSIEHLEIGKVVCGIAQLAVNYNIKLPAELSMLGQTLTNLDHIAYLIDANFDTNSCIKKHVAEILQHRTLKTLSPSHLIHSILEAGELLEKLPGRIGKILELVANNELKMTIKAIDEQVLISGFQKIANRITVGIIVAALIIGAAMLMRVQTTFMIGGYPGLAMLCFLAAAGFGFSLIIEILVSDRKAH